MGCGGSVNPVNIIHTQMDPLGVFNGTGGSSILAPNGPKGLMGGKPKPSGDGGMAAAYQAQAQAQIQAAQINANAANHAADTALEGVKLQTDAGIKASQSAAIGGIIGSALGAHTTSEVIKQWLPAEAGAATIQSWELAQRWSTTMDMKRAGYQDVAIDYALSGKSYKALFSDPQWNALQMANMNKKDILQSVQQFGIASGSNPHGIQMTPDDWMQLHAYKDPSEILKVDPVEAQKRNAEFAKWQDDMIAQGHGLIVNLVKNPQLAGSSILSMKGPEPLLDPALAPLLGSIGGMDQNVVNGLTGQGGGSSATNSHFMSFAKVKGGGTTSNNNDMAAQIKWAMSQGIIDKYGMVNAGALSTFVPPQFMDPPNFNVYRDLGDAEKTKIQDQYNQFAGMKIDDKLIRQDSLGGGVTRKTKLNPDGTIAASAIEGYMTNSMGESVFVSMAGNRLQEWYDRQSMIAGKGPLFPSMMAPVTESELNGSFEPGFFHNILSQPNNGFAGQPKQPGATGGAPKTNMPVNMNTPYGSLGAKPEASTPSAPSASSSTGGAANPSPSGYSGAPLAAGDE